MVDRAGVTSVFSGAMTLGRFSAAEAPGAVACGNLLASKAVPAQMLDAFNGRGHDHLADRLIAAMQAGLAAGGEEGPVHSAGLHSGR